MSDDNIIHRSEIEYKEKMERSDGCKIDCLFKDQVSGKCAFETCLQEEIPPLQTESISFNCIICGKLQSCRPMDMFSEHRICPDCRSTIYEWIQKHDMIINHCESHASHG